MKSPSKVIRVHAMYSDTEVCAYFVRWSERDQVEKIRRYERLPSSNTRYRADDAMISLAIVINGEVALENGRHHVMCDGWTYIRKARVC